LTAKEKAFLDFMKEEQIAFDADIKEKIELVEVVLPN